MPFLSFESDNVSADNRILLPRAAQTGSYVRRRRIQLRRTLPPRPVRGFRGELADRFFAARPDADDAAFVAWCRDGFPPLPGR